MRHARGGFTLIELLVALALFAVIIPLAGGMIYLLLRAQTASGEAIVDAVTLSRFAETFRADVHTARSVSPTRSNSRSTELVLELDAPRVVSYSVGESGKITRTVKANQAIVRREEFRIMQSMTRFAIAADRRTVAALHQPAPLGVSGRAARLPTTSIVRIEAVVGRDRRFDAPVADVATEKSP